MQNKLINKILTDQALSSTSKTILIYFSDRSFVIGDLIVFVKKSESVARRCLKELKINNLLDLIQPLKNQITTYNINLNKYKSSSVKNDSTESRSVKNDSTANDLDKRKTAHTVKNDTVKNDSTESRSVKNDSTETKNTHENIKNMFNTKPKPEESIVKKNKLNNTHQVTLGKSLELNQNSGKIPPEEKTGNPNAVIYIYNTKNNNKISNNK
jgi:hypothetical protein